MIINLYVKGLPGTATEDEVRELFEPYGKVKLVKLIKDWNTNKPKGFGFVELISDQGLPSIIKALNGSDFKGQRLKVDRARPRREKAKASTKPSVNQRSGNQAPGNKEFVNPYHFVPAAKVCDKAVRPFLTDNSHFQDRFREGTLSGRVVCRMTTETDLFIGAGKKKEAKDDKPAELAPFELHGKRAIPASSIKGMLSSVMEAASNSALRVLEEKVYTRRREIQDREALSLIGILRKKGDRYFVEELPKKNYVYLGRYSFDKGAGEFNASGTLADSSLRDFSVKPLHYYIRNTDIRPADKPYKNPWLRSGSDGLLSEERYSTLGKDEKSEYVRGIIKHFGVVGCDRDKDIPTTKKHEIFIKYPTHREKNKEKYLIPVTIEAWKSFHFLAEEAFERDKRFPFSPQGRHGSADTPVRLREGDLIYYRKNAAGHCDKISFSACWRDFCGNTQKDNHAPGYFTAIDEKGYLLPPSLINQHAEKPEELKLTPVCALMGFVEPKKGKDQQGGLALAGRLFFSPGILLLSPDEEADSILLNEETLMILASPKLPCPEFYFHDCNDRTKMVSKKNLHPCGSIRPNGRKFYWHNNNPKSSYAPNNTYIKKHHLQLNKIRPVKEGEEFVFSIDFFNLMEFELGMLLYALKPNNAFRHQIGMGKPLGMGRIKVELANLLFVDRKTRYGKSALFDTRFFHQQTDSNLGNIAENFGRDGFHSMQFCQDASEPSEHDVAYYRNKFQKDVRSHYGNEWGAILEMIGDPAATGNLKVCYPPNPSGEEGKNFEWWVRNRGKQGMRKPLPVIKGAKAPTLPTDPRKQ